MQGLVPLLEEGMGRRMGRLVVLGLVWRLFSIQRHIYRESCTETHVQRHLYSWTQTHVGVI